MVKRPRAGGFALDSPVTPLPRPVGAGCGARWAARKGPREAGGRNGLWCAPSARGAVRAGQPPGPCCASLMRAAVLPLLERAAGKGPREAGGRNGPCRAPSARGVRARGGTEGRPAPKPAHPGELKGLLARPFAQGPALRGGEKREKRKGVCRRRLLRQTPSFSLSRSVLGMLCAGCPTALPWPVRPARRRRTPPARAPARPRPGPWPHTALPFRSS